MHGSALLYNLMLSEKARREMLVEQYRDQFRVWGRRMIEADLVFREWDRSRVWQLIDDTDARITPHTRAFVDKWVELARLPLKGANEEHARRLIHEREWTLKRGQARLENPRALERWGGAAGTRPLNYRWPVAKTMIDDIQKGLAEGAARA